MRPGGPSDSPSRVQSCTWCLRPLESTGHAADEDDSDEVGKVAEDNNEEEANPDDLNGSVDEDDPEEGSEEVGVPVDANVCVGVTLDDNGSVGDFAFVFLPIPFLARRSDVGACFLPFVIPFARSRGDRLLIDVESDLPFVCCAPRPRPCVCSTPSSLSPLTLAIAGTAAIA